MKLILLLSIAIVALAISPEPVPSCSRPDITLKDLPISVNETQSFNLNDIFQGYNLNYTIIGQPNFVQLRPKFDLLKTQKVPQPGLKNIHMDHVDNRWGFKLVTVSDAGNSTIIRWGNSSGLDAIPSIDHSATAESDPKITCFDAIWLNHTQLIVVDCVREDANHALQNIFLYLNSTTQQVIQKEVKNDMWVGFTSITRRKIVHYIEDGEHYLFRAYFADGVNAGQRHNTYAEILLFNDPYRPWAIKVLDRSFLNQDQLSITDFKEYLGDLYILDYHKGVISFDITPSQNIIIKGRYRTDSGYQSMGIYSNNMADEVLLALGNQHGIFEVDWTNQLRPVVVAKYSLMQGSRVTSLWVSEEYIACQVKANVTNSTNQTYEYHSTIIFDRGTRTYTNAYAVIHHSSARAILDLNIQYTTLLSIDQDSVDTYFIEEPYMYVYPQDSKDLNKEFSFTVKAESRNEYSGASLVCTFDFKFIVVDVDSQALWPTGITVPDTYYANYPGQLTIPLDRYVFGANITYGVQERSLNNDTEVPNHWVYQQNDTIIHWDKEPSLFKYSFLRKEQFEYMDDEYFFIYAQDTANNTHIAECKAAPLSKDIYCKQDSKFPHINYRVNNLTATAFVPHYGEWLHLVAVTFDQFPNEVFIYNVQKREMFSKPLIFQKGWEGRVQSIEFLGHYLVVVLRHLKTLVFYDMRQCYDHQEQTCHEVYRIDSMAMDKLGVPYFSPLDVYSSDFHPFVLFIQNVDSVIILDITKNGPILLQQIESPASTEPGFWKWKMAIAEGHLVIVNPPNLIEEFSLDELYTRKITHMTKTFPLYNYTILDNFDLDAADNCDLVYITAIDKNLPADKNTVILVYRTDTPAVASFYDVFHIEGKYDDVLIDVTGTSADYVTVAMGSILMTFRQYFVPMLVFEDNWSDFEFNITYTNDPEGRYFYLSKSTVRVANYPEKIVVNESKLNQSDFLTNTVNYEKQYKEVILDDSTWFNGTVLNYSITGCEECGNKIRVVNHLEDIRDFFAETDMEDYVFTRDGGMIQQFQSIIKMKHNGSIDQVTVLPSVLDGEHCTHIQHSWIYDYTLSACEHMGEIYLYTTTYTSFKPFVNGPFYSGAKYVSGLHIMEDIVILQDVDPNPEHLKREGGIMIFSMNHDPFDPEMFDLIEIIETDDLEHAINWPDGQRAYIGSAQLLFTNDSSLYRLIITELRHGLFFVDFKFTKGRETIEIIKVEFVDLNKLMAVQDLHMPNLAYFWGLAVTMEYYDKIYNYWQIEVVVTTTRFHTLKFDFHIDKTGTILQDQSKLSKVFYRYGYYDVAGYIKQFDGYFAIIHNLPVSLEPFDEMNRKVLSLYDTKQRWVFNQTTQQMEKAPQTFYENSTVPASWMLGGMGFKKGRLAFDFNFTFTRNRTDPFREISLLVVHDRQAIIRQVLINDYIKIITEGDIVGEQKGYFQANSDFNSVKIPLNVFGIDDGGLSGGAIVGIIIGSILVVVGGGYLVYRWNLKRKPKAGGDGLEDSLIDRDTLNQPKNEEESDDDDDDDEQDDEQDESSSEQEKAEEAKTQEAKTEAKPQPTGSAASGEQAPEVQQPVAEQAVEGAVEEEKKQ